MYKEIIIMKRYQYTMQLFLVDSGYTVYLKSELELGDANPRDHLIGYVTFPTKYNCSSTFL